jgi:hypothetical protein
VLSFLCLVLYKFKLISNTWHEYKWTWEIVLHIGICNWKIWKYKLLHSTLVGYNIYIVLFHLIQYYFQIDLRFQYLSTRHKKESTFFYSFLFSRNSQYWLLYFEYFDLKKKKIECFPFSWGGPGYYFSTLSYPYILCPT